MAVRLASGELPYRAFFFAHPPVHLLVPAATFSVTGFSVGVAKAIPVAAQGLAALLLWRAVRPNSRLMAVAALALHLLAYQVLMGSSDMDGENIATCFLMAGLLAASAARPALAGALAGLAVGTVLYAAAGAAAIGFACALRGRRAALHFAAGLAGTLALVFGASWAVGGERFLAGVFGFHAAKAPGAGRAAVLGAEGLAAAAVGWGQNLALDLSGPARWSRLAPGTPAGSAAIGLLGAALFAVQGAVLPERCPFYDVPAVPFLALLGGSAAAAAWRAVSDSPGRRAIWWTWAGAALFACHPLLAGVLQARAFPEETRRRGEVVRYPWRDPEALAGLAQVSRALFWSERRVRGDLEPAWRHALWNKAQTFSTAGAIADAVRSGSTPGETITGASTLAPLVALLAGRRMAANELDTNQKRFATGSLDDEGMVARALADRVRYVLAAPRSHFTEALLERDPRWAAHFERDRVFEDAGLSRAGPVRLVLYRRR